MPNELVAKAVVAINAPVARVWDALVNPDVIKRYMFGATVVSDWEEGAAIVWRGEAKGKPYEDKGRILAFERERRLQYSHFSPLTGEPDVPASYHKVTIELVGHDGAVQVALSQDNNKNDEARAHAEKNWEAMLAGLKTTVEGGRS